MPSKYSRTKPRPGQTQGVERIGYLAYVTSAGWLGYVDDKLARLTLETLHQGFNHFKVQVGSNIESGLRRGEVIQSAIVQPANLPKGRKPPSASSTEGKNVGPTGMCL